MSDPYYLAQQQQARYQTGQGVAPHPNAGPIPIDPALSGLYSSFYPQYAGQPSQSQPGSSQQQQRPQPLPAMHSSPSEDSESIASPNAESSNANGKRQATGGIQNRKKQRKEDHVASQSPGIEKDSVGKVKPTRGSRACTVCRRLKMKCVGAEQGPPCKRCQAGNNECIFEESNRGKRSSKKHELLTRSLRKMERTLDTVLRSISNPGMSAFASGMVSRSPSPSAQSQTAHTQALLNSPSPPPNTDPSPSNFHSGSPKLHSLPDNSLNPLGLLAEASLSNRRAQIANQSNPRMLANSLQPEDSKNVGVASDVYFKPGPMTILPLRRLYIERQVQPEMLTFVSTEEVVELFDIYFESMNPQCNLLERDFHTPSLVCSRSPFLLTTICAIASKFYSQKPDLHPRLNNLAKSLAFRVPERGYKSVEIVQAYLLLTLWGCGPVERYEQDKTWLLLGMAIRMGTDLNLHRKTATVSQPTEEDRARIKEVLNRERTWLICFALDRSFSAQMGKPHSVKEDFIIRNAGNWWRSPYSALSDSSVCAYVELQRILSRSLDFLYSGTSTASGLQTDCDYLLVTKTIETQIMAWSNEWTARRNGELADRPNMSHYKVMGSFYLNYALLVVNSFGLQNALERSAVDIGHFFARCHAAATACATIVRDELGPSGRLPYCTDSNFVQCSYAVLSLLKFIRPEFQPFLENEPKTIALVKDVADLLERVAVGPLHTPALYSTLLRALISAKVDGNTTIPNSPGTNANDEKHEHSLDPNQMLSGVAGELRSDGTVKPSMLGGMEPTTNPLAFQSAGEMGPVADMSIFPPRMASSPLDETSGLMSMESILSNDFWDSVLVPGYSNTLEGLSGGFVYGAGGNSVYIASRLGTPIVSATHSPLINMRPELTNPLT
ncbi:hypothetical protein K439DRAFT_1413481 [Ramaria rubella]|nr:hypothetical protein K439DRAFT_1413481 [Ramaria rubella]